jgi:excinuclease ABC subunit B
MPKFKLIAPFSPTGDQPKVIEKIATALHAGVRRHTMLGVTGSGKTFTMANIIEKLQMPALVISHNKTLAAQLYQEFKEFFPENAVHYFVSYYDYYQPEAYLPASDTYIEKDAKINDVIDAMRHSSTASLLTRDDVIIVASVSCIYGIGDPDAYYHSSLELKNGESISRKDLLRALALLQYVRNPLDPRQGHFRIRENTIEIHLPSGEEIISAEMEKGRVASLERRARDPKKENKERLKKIRIFPAKHFVTPQEKLSLALANIRRELRERLEELKKKEKILEAARLKQRTEYDCEMIASTGYVSGIENYSRQLDFREPGTPPHTLLDYFRRAREGGDFLTFIDESHASIPQIRGMYQGDRARKLVLVDYGFRLPSALDNRPLTFKEFNAKVGAVVYVSATPGPYELAESGTYVAEQLIRPTGILDPAVEIRPTKNQIKDMIAEIKSRAEKNERSLVMALTKRLAEDIADYLREAGLKAEYLHAEVKTLERPEKLKKLRTGAFDVLVGINLLREGIDLPEVSFIAILDADREGFLRNETTLLQIIGRAARHVNGRVILYADAETGSIKAAMKETARRRSIQERYNREHGITPRAIKKEIRETLVERAEKEMLPDIPEGMPEKEILASLEREMKRAAKAMDFERAAMLRDRMKKLTGEK